MNSQVSLLFVCRLECFVFAVLIDFDCVLSSLRFAKGRIRPTRSVVIEQLPLSPNSAPHPTPLINIIIGPRNLSCSSALLPPGRLVFGRIALGFDRPSIDSPVSATGRNLSRACETFANSSVNYCQSPSREMRRTVSRRRRK